MIPPYTRKGGDCKFFGGHVELTPHSTKEQASWSRNGRMWLLYSCSLLVVASRVMAAIMVLRLPAQPRAFWRMQATRSLLGFMISKVVSIGGCSTVDAYHSLVDTPLLHTH